MPASMTHGKCYIKYEIFASLHSNSQVVRDQVWKRALHIREPPRNVKDKIKGQDFLGLECCCSCTCCPCGAVTIKLEIDSKYIEVGKKFTTKVTIDNSKGRRNIANWKLELREVCRVFGDDRTAINLVKKVYTMHAETERVVGRGKKHTFELPSMLPRGITGYTAIGNLLYKSYYLILTAETSCTTSNSKNPQIVVPIVVVDRT
jgi:hypothetical protein